MADLFNLVKEQRVAVNGFEMGRVLLFDDDRVGDAPSGGVATSEKEHVFRPLIADGQHETVNIHYLVEQNGIALVEPVGRDGERIGEWRFCSHQFVDHCHTAVQRAVDAAAGNHHEATNQQRRDTRCRFPSICVMIPNFHVSCLALSCLFLIFNVSKACQMVSLI